MKTICTYCYGKGHATVFDSVRIEKRECRHCRGSGHCPIYTYETGGHSRCQRCLPRQWWARVVQKVRSLLRP